MNIKNRKNLIIGLLCLTLVFMGIGYSIFNSTLNITGTAKSSGNFDVQITNVTMKSKSSDKVTDTTQAPGYEPGGHVANLSVKFNEPGDYITYTLEVSNLGTIDAIIKAAVKGTGTNDEYFDMTCNLRQPRELLVGDKTNFDCTIKYDKDATILVDPSIIANMVVTVEVVQKANSNITVQDFNPMFIVNSEGVITGYNGGSDVVIPETYSEAIIKKSNFNMDACISVVENELEAGEDANDLCEETKSDVENGTVDSDTLTFLQLNNVVSFSYEEGDQIPIRKIGDMVFSDTQVTSLDLSHATNLKEIGAVAFHNHKISGTITIPSSVEKISNNAFARDTIDSENIITGLLFESGSKLKTIGRGAFHQNGIGGTLIIPSSVETIESLAFELNNFASLDLTNATNLKTIGNQAFNLNKLTGTLTIPSNLVSIGSDAFAGSGESYNQINNLIFANNSKLQEIGNNAFQDNAIGPTLSIPDSVKSIGERAFSKNNIQTLSLGSSLESLNDGSFAQNNISSISINMTQSTWNSRNLPTSWMNGIPTNYR